MRPWTLLASVMMMVACGLMLPAWVSAAVVGHITQIEGRVDLLRAGKLPAIAVALQDKVESGDVLRTKSQSKAQITFVDNSVITLSPGSRLAVDEYQFEPGQQKRNAVLNLFQGMAHVLVNKLFEVKEPDFVIKTHTAVTGVRGTDFGIRLQPNASTILNFQGVTQVANIFPEVGKLNLKAFKAAFAFGSPHAANTVLLKDMQGTTVGFGLPPTLPFTITAQDKQQFMNQLSYGVISRKEGQGSGSGSTAGSGGSSAGGSAGTEATGGGTGFISSLGGPDSSLATSVAATDTTSPAVPLVDPAGLTTGTGNTTVTTLNTLTVPPVDTSTQSAATVVVEPVVNPPTPPTPPTAQVYSFTQTTQNSWTSTAVAPYTSNTVNTTGWGVRTGVSVPGTLPLPDSYTGYFTSSGTGDRTVLQGSFFPASSTGVSASTLTGTVTGVPGATLTGTGTLTGTSSFGQTTSYSGPVTIDASGVLTFTYDNGTISSQARLSSASGTSTSTPGTYFTQTLSGGMSNSASNPYNTQSTTTVWAGATTASGNTPLAHYYAATLTGTQTSPWSFSYRSQSYDSLGSTVQGVVNHTTLQGAASIIPNNPDTPFVSWLATPPSPYLFGSGANDTLPIVTTVSINPNTGVVSGQVYTNDYQDGKYASGVYTLTQTPVTTPVTPITGAYNFTETYNGAFMLNGATISPGTTNGFGYGLRSGTGTLATYYNGYFAAFDQGSWTATSGSLPTGYYGSALLSATPGTPGPLVPGATLLSGSVSGTLGQNLTGTMTWVGSLLNGASFNYQGRVTLDSSGYLQFDYGNSNGSATWMNFNGASGTAAGTMYQYPGYFFTQTMPGTYQLNTDGTKGTLSMAGSSGTRSVVYGGNLGAFNALFSLYSANGALPQGSSSGTMSSDLVLQGVVGTSSLGASFGSGSLSINTSPTGLSMIVPGTVSLSPGGTNFLASGVFVQNNTPFPIQVNSYNSQTSLPTGLTQLPLYGFSETYNGFRISAGSTPFTLASGEGYGWGTMTGSGNTPLPTSYTGGATTGYFVSQDLGTRAALSAMTPGWAGVTGTLAGTLSGTSGQTLTGQMAFTGTSNLGAVYNYQGTATLAANGTLVWNYYGTWTAGNNSGTASGTWTQVLGTYFTETVNSGTFVQASTSTTIGGTTYSSVTVQDAAPLGGTRTVGTASPTAITASAAGILTSTVNTPPTGSSTGTPNMTMQGVVAGSTWETRWGVATLNGSGSPSSTGISGPVTLDPSGKLTGQFVSTIPNGPGQPVDNVVANYVSVPTGSGQTTSSFVQTVSGTVTQTPIGTTPSTQGTLTTPTPLSGTGTGTIPGNVGANVNLNTMAASPTYVTAGTGPMSAQIIGAVGGPAGGPQTGVTSMHSIKTVGGNPRALQHLGTVVHQPATGTTPASSTLFLNGLNPSSTGVAASQGGTVKVAPQ
jgi:hypothetical protein